MLQFAVKTVWLPFINLSFGVDGISIFFIILTTFLIPLCILASYKAVSFAIEEFLVLFILLEILLIFVLFVVFKLFGSFIITLSYTDLFTFWLVQLLTGIFCGSLIYTSYCSRLTICDTSKKLDILYNFTQHIFSGTNKVTTVSYTHLTLPTIYSV